jgi:hypothetical protein
MEQEKSMQPTPQKEIPHKMEQESYHQEQSAKTNHQQATSSEPSNIVIQNVEDLEIVIDESDTDPNEFSA